MSKIIFHIGYPRTGTSYLQKKVFIKLKSLNFLGKPFNKYNAKLFYNFEKKIFSFDEIFFQDNKKFIAKDLKKLFKKPINLISHEGLLRNTRFYEKREKYFKGNNYTTNLKRIHQVLSLITNKQKIYYLIFIRKQTDILPSYFSNFWKSELEIYKQLNFEKFINDCLNPKKYNFGKVLNYYNLYNYLTSFISKKNIIFIEYESFFLKENIFLKKFAKVLNLSEKKIYFLVKDKKINSNKKGKYFYYKNMNSLLPKFLKKKFFLEDKIKKKIFNYYKSSNYKLSQKLKYLNLKSKNYY